MKMTNHIRVLPDNILEAPFLREGAIEISGNRQPLFVAHRDVRCEDCERPLSSDLAHPAVNGDPDIREVCGGYLVRIVD